MSEKECDVLVSSEAVVQSMVDQLKASIRENCSKLFIYETDPEELEKAIATYLAELIRLVDKRADPSIKVTPGEDDKSFNVEITIPKCVAEFLSVREEKKES